MNFKDEVEERLRNLAKPPGSLGLLEEQAKKAFLAWGYFPGEFVPKHIIFAADNGICRSGAVAQLPEITYMQSHHMVEGTSAVTCFCRCNQIPWEVVDIGIDSPDAVGLDYKIARGTKDFSKEPAMTEEELHKAFDAGRERVLAAKRSGYNFLSFGELGIGNTTTSAAVLMAIAPRDAASLVGYGSARGNFRLLLHKRDLIRRALASYGPHISGAADALRYVGGFDLAALASAMCTCARERIPFYIDGFITAAALAAAVQMMPQVSRFALPSHMSREAGMSVALHAAGIDDYDVPLWANLSLGEGTGAVLAVTLLRSMLYAVNHMATLDGINADAEQRHADTAGKGDMHHGTTRR